MKLYIRRGNKQNDEFKSNDWVLPQKDDLIAYRYLSHFKQYFIFGSSKWIASALPSLRRTVHHASFLQGILC